MDLHNGKIGLTGLIVLIAVIINAIVLRNGFIISAEWYWGLCFTIPVLAMALFDLKNSNKENK